MRSVYITTQTADGKTHNYRMSPKSLMLDSGETVVKVSEGTWKVTDLLDSQTIVKAHALMRKLQGVQTRR